MQLQALIGHCAGCQRRISDADPTCDLHLRARDSRARRSVDGKRLCVSLSTLELTPQGRNTALKHTTQLASFIGQDMVDGHTTGTNASLDNLVRHFSK